MVLEYTNKENASNQRVIEPSTPPPKKTTNLLSPQKPRDEEIDVESPQDNIGSEDEVSEMHPGSPVQNQRNHRLSQLKNEVLQVKQVREVEIERKYTHCSSMDELLPMENWESQNTEEERKYSEEEVKEFITILSERIKTLEVDLINLQEDCIQYQQEYFKIKEEGCSLYEFFISKTNSLKDLKEKYQLICEQYDLQRAENNELLLQLEHSNLLASEWKLKHKQQADRFKENIDSCKHLKEENQNLREEIQSLHEKIERLSQNGQNNSQSNVQLNDASTIKQLTSTVENYKKQIANKSSDFDELKENFDNLVHSQQLQSNQLSFLKKKCSHLFTEIDEGILSSDYENDAALFSLHQKVQDVLSLLQTDDENVIRQSMNSHSQLDAQFDSFKPTSSDVRADKSEKKNEGGNEQLESLQISNEILRSEIDELQKKLYQAQLQSSKYENQIQVSKMQIQNLQANITQLQEQVNSSTSSSSNLTNEVQLLRLQVRNLENEIAKLTQENQSSSAERSAHIAKIAELQTLNNNLQNDLRLIYKKHKMDLAQLNDTYMHEDYKSRYQLLLAEFTQMKNHYQSSFELYDDLMELMKQYDQLKDLVESNAELVMKVHQQNDMLSIDRSIQREYEKLNQQFTELQSEHQKVMNDFNSLFTEEAVVMDDNSVDNQMQTNFGILVRNLKVQNETLSSSLCDLQKSYDAKDELATKLTNENEKFANELKDLKVRFSELTNNYDNLQAENVQMNEMIQQNDVLSQKFDELLMKVTSQNQLIQSETANYQQVIQNKDQDIANLTNQLETANAENNSLSLQAQSVQLSFDEFKEREFAVLQENYQTLSKTHKEALENIQKLNETLNELKSKVSKLTDENKSLTENKAFLTEKLQFSTSQMEEMEKELEKIQTKLINAEIQEQRSADLWKKKEKALTDQLSDLQNTLEMKDKKLQKQEGDMEKKLSSTTEEFEQQIAKLNTTIQKLEKQKESLKTRIEELGETLNEKEKEILKKEKEIENLNDQIESITQQNQNTVEDYQLKISKLDDQMKQSETSWKNKEAEWNNNEQNLLVEKDKLKLEIEELANGNEELTKKLAQLRSALSDWQLKGANLKHQLENETLLANQLKKAVASLESELSQQCVETKVTENERDQLLLQNEMLLLICDEKGIIDEAKLLNEKNELQKNLSSAYIRLEEKELRIKDLQSRITQSQNRFAELKEKYKTKLSEFQTQLNHSNEESLCLNTMLTHIRNLVTMHQNEIRQSEKLQSLLSLIPQVSSEC